MTFSDFVTTLEEPWVSIIFSSMRREEVPQQILLVELDGRNMSNSVEMYNEFASLFKFPDYFGRNLNALFDCLTDLEWLPAEGYLLVIKNAGCLLKNEPDESLFGLISTLQNVGREWATPIKQGSAWDRDGLPFHSIFELDRNIDYLFFKKIDVFETLA